jgi:hypothetical protein
VPSPSEVAGKVFGQPLGNVIASGSGTVVDLHADEAADEDSPFSATMLGEIEASAGITSNKGTASVPLFELFDWLLLAKQSSAELSSGGNLHRGRRALLKDYLCP